MKVIAATSKDTSGEDLMISGGLIQMCFVLCGAGAAPWIFGTVRMVDLMMVAAILYAIHSRYRMLCQWF